MRDMSSASLKTVESWSPTLPKPELFIPSLPMPVVLVPKLLKPMFGKPPELTKTSVGAETPPPLKRLVDTRDRLRPR